MGSMKQSQRNLSDGKVPWRRVAVPTYRLKFLPIQGNFYFNNSSDTYVLEENLSIIYII